MVYLSVLSITASFLYFYVGFLALKSNKRSRLCRICFYLTLSMTIWSFAEGFLYLADNDYIYSFWNKIAAFGWCTFEALVLLFVLTLIENKMVRHWYIRLLIMIPAFLFLFMALFLFGPNIDTPLIVQQLFYTGDFLYNFSYLAISIILLHRWGRRAKSRLQKRQAHIIVISSVIPFFLDLLVQTVLPALHILRLPNIGQIFTLIMLFGVNTAIKKYQFLSIPTAQLTNEFFNELAGLIFLVDSQGRIMKTNQQVHQLLEYNSDGIGDRYITEFIKDIQVNKVLSDCEELQQRIKFTDIQIETRQGKLIPLNITLIPLKTDTNLIRGVLVIGEDIRVTKCLQDEIIKHKLTNEKLQNSEMLLRRLLEITPVAILVISRISGNITYLNVQAAELFAAQEESLAGKEVALVLINPEEKYFLIENMENNRVKKSEIRLKRLDKTEFIGLVTVIWSVMNDEEVSVVCVVDMTEHKRVEETLKKNNEYIIKLNKELMDMNDDLTNKSIRDGLTNLYNHQYMNEVLERKLQESAVSEEKLCLMMMDIDHFKRVNDRYGHLTGDRVLTEIADMIFKNTRERDYIGRYGGEEFIVILPGTEMEEACRVAQMIRTNIYNHEYGSRDLKVTISIGVVQYAGETSNELINRADMLLYQAKANGRNRVEKQAV